MHSTVYAVVRGLSICLVCLSVPLAYCVETTERIIKQLALDYSVGTLVYGHQT